MLRFFGFIFRVSLYTLVVLMLGNWIEWKGRTLNDQIKYGMAHAERTSVFRQMRNWANDITREAKVGFQKKEAETSEEIPASERQKLHVLIQDLNRPHSRRE